MHIARFLEKHIRFFHPLNLQKKCSTRAKFQAEASTQLSYIFKAVRDSIYVANHAELNNRNEMLFFAMNKRIQLKLRFIATSNKWLIVNMLFILFKMFYYKVRRFIFIT